MIELLALFSYSSQKDKHFVTFCQLFVKERSNIRRSMACVARKRFQVWTCRKFGRYSFLVQNPVSLFFDDSEEMAMDEVRGAKGPVVQI